MAVRPDPEPCVEIERTNHVMTLWLNRPAKRNALDMAMCDALIEVARQCRISPDIRLVLLRARGSAFCSGIDLSEFVGKDVAWVGARRDRGLDAYVALESIASPVVALVNGAAVGGGCELIAACDFAIAEDISTFRWPETVWGAVGATQRLPRKVGSALALDLLLTGRALNADAACAAGLLSRVVPAGALDTAAADLARSIGGGFPFALRTTKKVVRDGLDHPLSEGIALEREAIRATLEHDEWRAGLDAFLARRRG